MGLRIKTNVSSLIAQRHLKNNRAESDNSLERLSSGLRVNKSADDAAGLAISENIRARVRALQRAKQNASDGIGLFQVAEGGLNELSNILIRLNELGVQSASDTVGENERVFLNQEFQALITEANRIAVTTEFNGRKMLVGEGQSDFSIQVGPNSSDDDAIITDLSTFDARADTLGIEGLEISEKESAKEILDVIVDAQTKIAENRAVLGASQSRLQSAINNLDVQTENLAAAQSRIRDVDFAEETAKLAQANILSAAGVSVQTQANQVPELALKLL